MLFKTPLMLNLFIAYFTLYAVNWGLVTWIPTYLVDVRNLNLVSLGWLQTIPGVAQLVGMLLSGYIIDRLSNNYYVNRFFRCNFITSYCAKKSPYICCRIWYGTC